MSRRIQFKLSGKALESALYFSDQVGLDLNSLARQCLLRTIMDAYAQAAQHAQKTAETTPIPTGVIDTVLQNMEETAAARVELPTKVNAE